jgi:transposase InsO family protein
MDLVGQARVQSVGGKWYVLVVVDDYSQYAWFFLEEKGETFGFVRDLVLRLRNERHGDAIRAIHSDNGSEFRNSCFETFCHDLGLEH